MHACVCVCVLCVCVCVWGYYVLTSGVIWTLYDRLNKLIRFYTAAGVGIIGGRKQALQILYNSCSRYHWWSWPYH